MDRPAQTDSRVHRQVVQLCIAKLCHHYIMSSKQGIRERSLCRSIGSCDESLYQCESSIQFRMSLIDGAIMFIEGIHDKLEDRDIIMMVYINMIESIFMIGNMWT